MRHHEAGDWAYSMPREFIPAAARKIKLANTETMRGRYCHGQGGPDGAGGAGVRWCSSRLRQRCVLQMPQAISAGSALRKCSNNGLPAGMHPSTDLGYALRTDPKFAWHP